MLTRPSFPPWRKVSSVSPPTASVTPGATRRGVTRTVAHVTGHRQVDVGRGCPQPVARWAPPQ